MGSISPLFFLIPVIKDKSQQAREGRMSVRIISYFGRLDVREASIYI